MRNGNNLTLTNGYIGADIRNAMQRVLVNPKFARNIRGRLAAALRLLDAPLQARLACDYAEHVVWICEERLPTDPRFRQAIVKTKQFLRGEATIQEVAQDRLDLYKGLYELPEPHNFEVQVVVEAAWAVELAIKVCCQRQLETLRVIARTGHQPRVNVVASKASYAVARYAGGEDWDSDDPKLKAAARKRGKVASDAETEWQINRLLDYVGYHCHDASQESAATASKFKLNLNHQSGGLRREKTQLNGATAAQSNGQVAANRTEAAILQEKVVV